LRPFFHKWKWAEFFWRKLKRNSVSRRRRSELFRMYMTCLSPIFSFFHFAIWLFIIYSLIQWVKKYLLNCIIYISSLTGINWSMCNHSMWPSEEIFLIKNFLKNLRAKKYVEILNFTWRKIFN
jgi:hypothetical protein